MIAEPLSLAGRHETVNELCVREIKRGGCGDSGAVVIVRNLTAVDGLPCKPRSSSEALSWT